MMSTPPLAAVSIDLRLWLDSLPYQVVGLCVAFTVVGLIWLLMEGLGLAVFWWDLSRDGADEHRVSSDQSLNTSEALPAGVLGAAYSRIDLSSRDSGSSTELLRKTQEVPLPKAEKSPPPPCAETASPSPPLAPPSGAFLLQKPQVFEGVPPEVIAVISAAVYDGIEVGAHIVSIVPLERLPEHVYYLQAWPSEGRRQHFASHKVR